MQNTFSRDAARATLERIAYVYGVSPAVSTLLAEEAERLFAPLNPSLPSSLSSL